MTTPETDPDPTPVTDELAKSWDVVVTMKEMCSYYGYHGEIPVHIITSMQAPDGISQVEHRKRLLQKLHIHLMALWAKGEIMGPKTYDNLNALARRAEQSAAGLMKMKQEKAAEKQLRKASEYRAQMLKCEPQQMWW